jgi:transposase
MSVATIGLDIAKQFFQVHGVDASGRVVLRKKLRRSQVAAFFANLPVCMVDWRLAADLIIGCAC